MVLGARQANYEAQLARIGLSSKKIGDLLVVCLILFAPLNNIYELVSFFQEGSANLTSYDGPILLKLIKDLGILSVIALYVLFSDDPRRPYHVDSNLVFISFFILFLFAISATINGLLMALSGIRWFLPLFLIAVLKDRIDSQLLSKVCTLIFHLLLLNFVLQVFELFNMPHWYGENMFGLAGRVPGFFLLPNSSAFFIAVSFAAIVNFDNCKNRRILAYIVAPVSVFLTQSGTGIISVLLIILLKLSGRYRTVLLVCVPFLLAFLLFNINAITGRGDYLQISGGGRLEILLEVLNNNLFSFGSFGLFTNTGVLVASAYMDGEVPVIVADSFWAALIGNCGFLGIFFIVCLVFYVHNNLKKFHKKDLFPMLLVYVIFSFTTIVTEAYPMNVLLPIFVWGSRLKEKNQLAS
jgi:hypothetical protein